MVYIAIDNSSVAGQKMVALMEEMPFATVYRELNATTNNAFKEIEDGKTISAESPIKLLKKLKK